MTETQNISEFLSQYDESIQMRVAQLRQLIPTLLPDVIEQLDIPAKMIAYTYGQKYADLICVVIPSKKGVKLGFNRGVLLPDPDKLLEGTGKISRYVEIKNEAQIHTAAIKNLLESALGFYSDFIG